MFIIEKKQCSFFLSYISLIRGVTHGKPFVFNVEKRHDGWFRVSVKIDSHVGEGVAQTSKLAKRDAAADILAKVDPINHAPGLGLVPEKVEDTLASVFHVRKEVSMLYVLVLESMVEKTGVIGMNLQERRQYKLRRNQINSTPTPLQPTGPF